MKAPKLTVRLNASNWRFNVPPTGLHHIGVRVPQWDHATNDDDHAGDGHGWNVNTYRNHVTRQQLNVGTQRPIGLINLICRIELGEIADFAE